MEEMNAAAYMERADNYGTNEGDLELALSYMEKAVAMDPDNVEYQEKLGRLKGLMKEKGFDNAKIREEPYLAKTSEGKGSSFGDYLSDLGASLKMRLLAIPVFLVGGLIIGLIRGTADNVLTDPLTKGFVFAFFGAILGIGIFPLLIFAIRQLEKIPDIFKVAFELGRDDGIKAFLSGIALAILYTVLWTPFKVILFLYACPFVGLFQIVKLSISAIRNRR